MRRLRKLSRLCLAVCLLAIAMIWAYGADTEASASPTNTFLTDVPTGTGTQDDPYQISKIEHLDYVRDHLDKHYILMNDLDFTSLDDYLSSDNMTVWMTGSGWVPIGDNSNKFSGTFNANGHVIKGLYIDRDENFQGLFGYTGAECHITNGKLESVSVKGRQCTGALAGFNNGNITNFSVQGEVSGRGYVGGLVGQNTGNILRSSMVGTVIGELRSIGGLVGYTCGGNIGESYALVTVEGIGSVGGLVGKHERTTTHNSYALGKIDADNFNAGGLIGVEFHGIISNCYAVGEVTASIPSFGYWTAGGLIGDCDADPEVVNSYYDSTVAINTDTDRGEPKITADMKSMETFKEWNFTGEDAIWDIVNTPTHYSYPYLINNRQDPAPGYTLRAPKIITAFEFNQLSPTVSGIIDQENKTIRVLVPDGTDINNLVPTITYSGQTITPDTEEAQDFSDQVSYTVTAEDQSQQTYTVTVIIKEKDPFIVAINGIDSITVTYGASSAEVIAALPETTAITDSNGDTHLVNITWDLSNYNCYQTGAYLIEGTFLLPTEVQQADPPIDLQVFTIVRVEPQPVTPPTQYTPPSGRSSEQYGSSSEAKDPNATPNSVMSMQMLTIIKPWIQLSSWIMLQAPVMIGLWT
jgi:hypothetical protein